MKTKSLLFAALVTLTLSTTSCNDENIQPSTTNYRSPEIIHLKDGESKTFIEGSEVIVDEQTTPNQEIKSTAIPANDKPNNSTGKINIMQVDSDEVK